MATATHDKGDLWAEPICWDFGECHVFIVTRNVAFVEFDKNVELIARDLFKKGWAEAFPEIVLLPLPDVAGW